MNVLATLDWWVIGIYFVAIFAAAVIATVRERRSGAETSADYFLAGRNVGWFVIGASLFASNIGSEHLVGLAGTGAASGVAVGQFEILASLILLLLGWVFVPFYLRSGVFTMPEFLERRYSPGRPLVSRGHLDHRLRAHQDLGDHRRRRHRLRGPDGHRLLDRRPGGGDRHRHLHRLRRPAGRALSPTCSRSSSWWAARSR